MIRGGSNALATSMMECFKKNLNLSFFNMITGINESKTLTKDIWKKI